jgi:hypothetical protein
MKNVIFFVIICIILVFLRMESLKEHNPFCDIAIAETTISTVLTSNHGCIKMYMYAAIFLVPTSHDINDPIPPPPSSSLFVLNLFVIFSR